MPKFIKIVLNASCSFWTEKWQISKPALLQIHAIHKQNRLANITINPEILFEHDIVLHRMRTVCAIIILDFCLDRHCINIRLYICRS